MTDITTDNMELVIGNTDTKHNNPALPFKRNFIIINETDKQRQLDITAAQAAATSASNAYTDAQLHGLSFKAPVRAVALTNVNLSAPGSVFDGVTFTGTGVDSVLLAGQTDATQNGPYTWNGPTSALTRRADADSSAEMQAGLLLIVTDGTSGNADKVWELKTEAPITLGTTPLTFGLASGSTSGLALAADLTAETSRATAAEAAKRARYVDQGTAKTASYTMSVWHRAKFNTTSAPISQPIPDGTTVGDEVQIYLESGTNTLTLTGTGGPFTISVAGHGVTLYWTGSAWEETQDRKTLSSLDARYQVRKTATIIIAANDSTSTAKLASDIVCTGTNDQVTINAAIASLDPRKGGMILLRIGSYNCSAPIVIDNDYLTLTGEAVPMFGGFNGNYPTHSTESPGGTKIKFTASSNGIEIHGSNVPVGDPRHRGIAIRYLYLFGYNYTGTAIYNPSGAADSTHGGPIDWSFFEYNQIHAFQDGITMYADTPQICRNSIQDIAGVAITALGPTYGTIAENLIFDNGGTAISANATGMVVMGNTIGRVGGNGIVATAASVIIANNHLETTTNDSIRATGSKCSVTGNTINQNASTQTNGIYCSGNNCTVASNTLANAALSTGEAISFRAGATNCTANGNSIVAGGWKYPFFRGVGNTIRNNGGYKDHNHGSVVLVDGGTIAHGLAGGLITNVQLSPQSTGAIPSIASVDPTTIKVALKDTSGTAISTGKVVYFVADLGDDIGPCAVTTATLLNHWSADMMAALTDATAITLIPDYTNACDLGPVGAPTFYNNVLNGKPGIRLNGTNMGLVNTSVATATTMTIFLVLKRASVVASTTSLFNSNNANTNAVFINSSGNLCLFNTSSVASTLAPGTSAHVVEAVFNGASSSIGLDGTLQTLNPGAGNMGGGARIGTNNTGTGEWFNGDIYEVLYYSGAMSTGDRSNVRAALGAKYGITVS